MRRGTTPFADRRDGERQADGTGVTLADIVGTLRQRIAVDEPEARPGENP